MLELRALGNAEIRTGSTTLTPSQEIVFASALYLLLERERRISRSGLAELLWPGVEPSTRSHRLRQTLLQLKKLGFPVSADRDRVGLSTREVRTDIDRADSSGNGRSESDALEFLPGYSPLFSEPFRDWVDGKRSEINSNSSRALVALLGAERNRADWNAVEATARRILQLDPYNESAVLALAESSAMRGQKRHAVSILDSYLSEVGGNPDIRLPTSLLRKRILETPPNAPPIALPTPAFVGREVEMERLTARLKEAQKARGSACVVIGDPGIGKSRLASELTKFATLQGIRTATVSCQRSNVERPLSVLADLVPFLREMPGAIGCSQETLQVLRRLTEFDIRGAELSVATTESHSVHLRLRNALFDLLDAVTDEVSLCLVFDDVQWIDRASADILTRMAGLAKERRLLLLLNTRKTEAELLDSIVRCSGEVIELKALTQTAAEALLTSIVAEGALGPSSAQSGWILDVGEGNPFFLQELAKHWLESAGRAEAPSSVNNVLRERLSKLSPVSLKVLQACTVLGQSATVERVDKVLEYPSHELLGAIQELSAAGMVSCSGDSPEITPLSLRTRHDLLSNAVLDGLSSPSRGFLHRRAGLVLEKELLGDRMSTALLWECAFHWHHAGDRDRALSVIRSCSEHLLEVGLPKDASEALERALDYCSTDEQRMSVLARQVDALQMAGQWERSINVLRRCRHLRMSNSEDDTEHDSFEIMIYDALCRTNLKVLELLPQLRSCVECKDAPTSHRVDAGIIALKLATDVDATLMDAVYEQTAPLLNDLRPNDERSLEVEMVYHSTRGEAKRGLAAASTLVEIARESNDVAALAKALSNAANSYRINGSRGEAEQWLRELIACSLDHHFIERAAMGMLCVGKLGLAVGDTALAREMLERTKKLPTSTENLRLTVEQCALEARVLLLEGKLEQAVETFSYVRGSSAGHSLSRRSTNLAMEIMLHVAASGDAEAIVPLVQELEATHIKLRTMGLQDFETECLWKGLKAIGRESDGHRLVVEYLTTYRRERRPPAPSLAALVAAI